MNIKNSWKASFTFDIKVGPFRSAVKRDQGGVEKHFPEKFISVARFCVYSLTFDLRCHPSPPPATRLPSISLSKKAAAFIFPQFTTQEVKWVADLYKLMIAEWWSLIEHKTTAKSCSIVFITPHEIKINFRLIINHLLRLIHLWLFPFHSDESEGSSN